METTVPTWTLWLAPLAGVVGVLLGSLMAWWASSSIEKRRWKRERSSRWDDEKLKHYESFLTSLDQYRMAVSRWGRALVQNQETHAFEQEAFIALDELAAAHVAWRSLAGEQVDVSAQQAWDVCAPGDQGEGYFQPPELDAIHRARTDHRQSFRTELGIE